MFYTAMLFFPSEWFKVDGNTPEECLRKIQKKLTHIFTYRPWDMTVYSDHYPILKINSQTKRR